MANIITRNIPNSITCCNLISGCIATAYAFGGDHKMALLFIIIGAVFDFFDGMSARLLGVSSPIGKELDSLADDVTFGVAPSTMVFTLFSTLNYPPTPANALFWGALIVGLGAYLERYDWTIYVLLPMLLFSCYLLISEIPMFALKFKHWSWQGNEVKYIFLMTCIPLLGFFGLVGFAIIIAWYVALSVIVWKLGSKKQEN